MTYQEFFNRIMRCAIKAYRAGTFAPAAGEYVTMLTDEGAEITYACPMAAAIGYVFGEEVVCDFFTGYGWNYSAIADELSDVFGTEIPTAYVYDFVQYWDGVIHTDERAEIYIRALIDQTRFATST